MAPILFQKASIKPTSILPGMVAQCRLKRFFQEPFWIQPVPEKLLQKVPTNAHFWPKPIRFENKLEANLSLNQPDSSQYIGFSIRRLAAHSNGAHQIVVAVA